MKVLENGILNTVALIADCPVCGCVFEVLYKDIVTHETRRVGCIGYYATYVVCPECTTHVQVDPFAGAEHA